NVPPIENPLPAAGVTFNGYVGLTSTQLFAPVTELTDCWQILVTPCACAKFSTKAQRPKARKILENNFMASTSLVILRVQTAALPARRSAPVASRLRLAGAKAP